MTEPQVWTLIGVFAAAIFGIQGIAISSFRREMRGTRDQMITKMDAGFDSVNKRIDHLDRDVSFLMRKEFGENPSN